MVDLYILEHGDPAEGTGMCFLGGDSDACGHIDTLNIEVAGLTCGEKDADGIGYCYSKDFVYTTYCAPGECRLYANRGSNDKWKDGHVSGDVLEGQYLLQKIKNTSTGQWTQHCQGNCPPNLTW